MWEVKFIAEAKSDLYCQRLTPSFVLNYIQKCQKSVQRQTTLALLHCYNSYLLFMLLNENGVFLYPIDFYQFSLNKCYIRHSGAKIWKKYNLGKLHCLPLKG